MRILVVHHAVGTHSALATRLRYFQWALERRGHIVEEYVINARGFRKFLMYFLPRTPGDLVRSVRDIDIIFTSSPIILSAILSWKLSKDMGKPLIVDVRDLWEEYARGRYKLLGKLGVIGKLQETFHKALNDASLVTVPTKGMARYYSGITSTRIEVVPNGTDPDIIKPLPASKDYDLVYLGDFNNPYQNIEYLIKAASLSGHRILVIGGGRLLEDIKRYAAEHGVKATFIGPVPYDRLAQYLSKAKVGVVGRPFINNPQYLYTIPAKVYDYLAAGLPVAGYGPSGSELEEFINGMGVGGYTSSSDPRELAHMLERLVEDFESYRARAREVAIMYDRRRHANRLAELLEGITFS